MARAPQNVTRAAAGTTLAPPARAATAPRPARKSSAVTETQAIRRASAATAVTVDDNPVKLELASGVLWELGAGPILAADGAEAVALVLEPQGRVIDPGAAARA